MDVERFKPTVAGGIAAKTGITTEQAGIILDNVAKLSSTDTVKNLNVSGLEVFLKNQEVSLRPYTGSIKIFDCPYETVAKFKAGQDFQEITFIGLDRAASEPAGQVKLVEHGDRLVVLGGLEGDPDVDPFEEGQRVRSSNRQHFSMPEGEHDTDPCEESG